MVDSVPSGVLTLVVGSSLVLQGKTELIKVAAGVFFLGGGGAANSHPPGQLVAALPPRPLSAGWSALTPSSMADPM